MSRGECMMHQYAVANAVNMAEESTQPATHRGTQGCTEVPQLHTLAAPGRHQRRPKHCRGIPHSGCAPRAHSPAGSSSSRDNKNMPPGQQAAHMQTHGGACLPLCRTPAAGLHCQRCTSRGRLRTPPTRERVWEATGGTRAGRRATTAHQPLRPPPPRQGEGAVECLAQARHTPGAGPAHHAWAPSLGKQKAGCGEGPAGRWNAWGHGHTHASGGPRSDQPPQKGNPNMSAVCPFLGIPCECAVGQRQAQGQGQGQLFVNTAFRACTTTHLDTPRSRHPGSSTTAPSRSSHSGTPQWCPCCMRQRGGEGWWERVEQKATGRGVGPSKGGTSAPQQPACRLAMLLCSVRVHAHTRPLLLRCTLQKNPGTGTMVRPGREPPL
jgi:hypothetical protein